jgi:hypothetical protein
LDEAAMERAENGPAALDVLVSKEAVALPLRILFRNASKIIVRNNCHV